MSRVAGEIFIRKNLHNWQLPALWTGFYHKKNEIVHLTAICTGQAFFNPAVMDERLIAELYR